LIFVILSPFGLNNVFAKLLIFSAGQKTLQSFFACLFPSLGGFNPDHPLQVIKTKKAGNVPDDYPNSLPG
jgi:hypothetical protein